jgi:hypothetical protein
MAFMQHNRINPTFLFSTYLRVVAHPHWRKFTASAHETAHINVHMFKIKIQK